MSPVPNPVPPGASIALYGRFSPGQRDRFVRAAQAAGGTVARDLTRRSDVLVIGALAATLIDSGALGARLGAARARHVPVHGERAFADALAGKPPPPATLPIAQPLAQAGLTAADAPLLAAFDLIVLDDDQSHTRFADAAVLRAAGELVAQGRTRAQVVAILARARDLAPRGRHKIVLTPAGEAALQWDEGLTTLEGQAFLPLADHDHPTLDDLFDAAAVAEARGDLAAAARLYDQCARADRADAIALYNLANIALSQGDTDQAILAYQRALTRDPKFAEARYNLAQALEAAARPEDAAAQLTQVLVADPAYGDAVFNLAQLHFRARAYDAARPLYERYLTLDPPEDWAATARKAITYCMAQAG